MNRKRIREKERGEDGSIIMNVANIKLYCEEDQLCELPDLNTKLYLHFKGFKKIQNLQPYINVKVLWLENNLLTKIEGLDLLVQLTHLYLQNNYIEEIEGLNENHKLIQLNLSQNRIRKIENITHLTELQNLNLEGNKIESSKDIEQIIQNLSLTTIDLQNNFLKAEQNDEGEDNLLSIFMKMQDIRCIYLQNNDYLKDTLHYRKVMVGHLRNLTYLDIRPVTQKERILCEAFVLGGKEGEQFQKQKMDLEEQKQKEERSEEIKKTIPQHLINKIAFFEKTIKSLSSDLEQLQQQRTAYVIKGQMFDQINDTDLQIQMKEEEQNETQILLDNIRKRAGITKSITNSNQGKKLQDQVQSNLDELD